MEKLVSVSQLLDLIIPKLDRVRVANIVATKTHSNANHVLDEWQKKCNEGIKRHEKDAQDSNRCFMRTCNIRTQSKGRHRSNKNRSKYRVSKSKLYRNRLFHILGMPPVVPRENTLLHEFTKATNTIVIASELDIMLESCNLHGRIDTLLEEEKEGEKEEEEQLNEKNKAESAAGETKSRTYVLRDLKNVSSMRNQLKEYSCSQQINCKYLSHLPATPHQRNCIQLNLYKCIFEHEYKIKIEKMYVHYVGSAAATATTVAMAGDGDRIDQTLAIVPVDCIEGVEMLLTDVNAIQNVMHPPPQKLKI